MEQFTSSLKNDSIDNSNDNKLERKVTFISYKNLSNENLCEPFYYNEEEFKKRKKSMKHSNLQNLLSYNGLLNDLQRKKSLINFESTENKNKNLKIFNGNKMEPYLNMNNNNNYYLNRKYSSIIFNRFHKLNKTVEEIYQETVVNKLYFCTKINIKKEDVNKVKEKTDSKTKKSKGKKKSTSPNKIIKNKSEHKSIILKKIKINNNSTSNKKKNKSKNEEENNNNKFLNKIKFNNRFKNLPNEDQNKTMNDFRKKNNLKMKYTFPNNNNNKNKNNTSKKSKSNGNKLNNNSNNKNNKTFYPKLPNAYSKSQIKEEKENSSSNSNSYSRKRKHNYLFHQINIKNNHKNTAISNSKTITNKEILKTPIPKEKSKNKNKNELILPKINDVNNKTSIKLKKRKIDINPILPPQTKKFIPSTNINKNNTKKKFSKNKSSFNIIKPNNDDLAA